MADHFVKRILSATKDLMIADQVAPNVFRGRKIPLSDSLQHLPAINIVLGGDSPQGDRGFMPIGSFTSNLVVFLQFWARESDPEVLEDKLLELRKLAHISLMASDRLSLPFVIDIYPDAVEPPDYETEGQADIGMLSAVWVMEYRSNVDDPST